MGAFQGLQAFNVGVILGRGNSASDIDSVKTSGTLALGRLLSGAVNHVRNSIAKVWLSIMWDVYLCKQKARFRGPFPISSFATGRVTSYTGET